MTKINSIELVVWHDARSVDGWREADDFDEELSLIHTAGYLAKENDDAVFISACVFAEDDDKSFACTIVIPKKMILSRKVLEV